MSGLERYLTHAALALTVWFESLTSAADCTGRFFIYSDKFHSSISSVTQT